MPFAPRGTTIEALSRERPGGPGVTDPVAHSNQTIRRATIRRARGVMAVLGLIAIVAAGAAVRVRGETGHERVVAISRTPESLAAHAGADSTPRTWLEMKNVNL